MNIHERIQQLRKSRGLSQEQLADRLGVSRQAVSKWESRQSLPDIDKIIAISDYFSVSCDWLMKGEKSSLSPSTPEQSPQTKTVNKQRVMLTATCLNVVGFVMAVTLWREWQNLPALAIGFIFVLTSFFIMGMGATFMEQPDRDVAIWQWLKRIIWLDAVLPTFFAGVWILPKIYNTYYFSWPVGIAAIVFTYLFICLRTVYCANKVIRKSQQNTI